jgi:hypothetical protein
MAFPHQQSRQDHDRKKDKPSREGVLWNLVERTVNISVYRNANDDMNPAKNRTLLRDPCFHGQTSLSMAVAQAYQAG